MKNLIAAVAVVVSGTFAFAGEKPVAQAPAPVAKAVKGQDCCCTGTCEVKTVTVQRELTRREKRHLHLFTNETVQVVETPVVLRRVRGVVCR
jgi:hypothetical protein